MKLKTAVPDRLERKSYGTAVFYGLFRMLYCKVYAFPEKYSRVSRTTVPDSKKTAIRFGMDIRPLKVSARLHKSPRSTVAPGMDTRA